MRLSVKQAGYVVKRGGIVVYPTETLWGLGGDARNPEVVQRVREIKRTTQARPMPVLAESVALVIRLIDGIPPGFVPLTRSFWPGSLTLALPVKGKLLHHVGCNGLVAFRVSANPIAARLCAAAGGLLVSTSANFTGTAPPAALAEVDPALIAVTDGAVSSDERSSGLPSTVLLWKEGNWYLARAGAVEVEQIRKLIPSLLEPRSDETGNASVSG